MTKDQSMPVSIFIEAEVDVAHDSKRKNGQMGWMARFSITTNLYSGRGDLPSGNIVRGELVRFGDGKCPHRIGDRYVGTLYLDNPKPQETEKGGEPKNPVSAD